MCGIHSLFTYKVLLKMYTFVLLLKYKFESDTVTEVRLLLLYLGFCKIKHRYLRSSFVLMSRVHDPTSNLHGKTQCTECDEYVTISSSNAVVLKL